MVLRPSSRSQTTRPTSLADVYGGAFHNLSIMSNYKMPNIEAQSDSSLGDDLAPIAHPGHRDIERTFLAHHQHLIRSIWKCFRKTHGQVLERTPPDLEKLAAGMSIVNKATRGREMMMSSGRGGTFVQSPAGRLFVG